MAAGNGLMEGKVCLITGATSGIGEVTARVLAGMGAEIVVVSRSPQRCASTVARIQQETGNSQVGYLAADLSSQAQVRRLAQEFLDRYPRLDVLVNNAGAVFMNRQESVDGIEMTLALNHLNYFLLTHLLLERLKASAPARIVNVSSDAHLNGQIHFDDLQFTRGYRGFKAYAQSKLANVLFTYELDRRLEGTQVTSNALHPGFVATNFARNNGLFMNLAMRLVQLFALSPERGAQTIIYLASSPEVKGASGKYFTNKKPFRSASISYDQEIARKLWEVSEELAGVKDPDLSSR